MPKKKDINKLDNFAPDFNRSIPVQSMRFSFEKPNFKTKILNHKKRLIIAIIAVVALLGLGYGIKTIKSLSDAKKELEAIKSNSNEKDKKEAMAIVEQVGKLVILPEGEEPTVATVTDPTKLADQPFFANSQAGDKVLIYTTAQRAILYRPSSNKVIEIAPLNLGGDGGVAGTSIEPDSTNQETNSNKDNSNSNSNFNTNTN